MRELRNDEMMELNGGGINWEGIFDGALVGTGTISAAWSIPVAFFCPPAAVVMATVGAAAALVGTGVDVDLIKY